MCFQLCTSQACFVTHGTARHPIFFPNKNRRAAQLFLQGRDRIGSANRIGSTYLRTNISCVHCTSVCQSCSVIRRPGDTCLLEMGLLSKRLSLHRHQVHGSTSVNTSLEKGSVNIEAPETGITYIPIWARRGPSTSSSPSSAAWRKARDANSEALETGLTYRPIQAKKRGPALTQRQVSPIDQSGHEARKDFEVRPSAQRQASATSRSGSILENRHLPLGERLV